MSVALLCFAVVAAEAGEGVPQAVLEEARAVVAGVLDGTEGEVTLRLLRTATEMEEAVRSVEPKAPPDFAAYYHARTRTVFAFLAPRPDPPRLSGLLRGALVHEAQHARAHLRGGEDGPRWRAEGEADRDTVRHLAATDRTWELQLESRVRRARAQGLFAADELFRRIEPRLLAPGPRATWYAQAYALARGGADPELPWVLWTGSAEPFEGGYRLVSEPGRAALLVREAEGPLEVLVTPAAGRVEILFGFRSEEEHAKVVFPPRGGVRAVWGSGGEWTEDPIHPAPPLAAGTRIALRGGTVTVDGRVVLHVLVPEGKMGVGILDGLAEFRPSS